MALASTSVFFKVRAPERGEHCAVAADGVHHCSEIEHVALNHTQDADPASTLRDCEQRP